MTHDYTYKGGIVHKEIMLPTHAPPEFSDRSTLWNAEFKAAQAGGWEEQYQYKERSQER